MLGTRENRHSFFIYSHVGQPNEKKKVSGDVILVLASNVSPQGRARLWAMKPVDQPRSYATYLYVRSYTWITRTSPFMISHRVERTTRELCNFEHMIEQWEWERDIIKRGEGGRRKIENLKLERQTGWQALAVAGVCIVLYNTCNSSPWLRIICGLPR